MASSKTILVVDDEFSIVESLVEILTWEGYGVRTASNGKAALSLLADFQPDLILLDYMMPVMNGLEMLKALRQDTRLSNLPVVMMTAAPLQVEKGQEPWNAFLRKPFELEALMGLVKRFTS